MLLIAYGTRPEYIKLKPVIDKLTIPYRVLFTGQHEDIAPVDPSFERLKMVNKCENRLDNIVVNIAESLSLFDGVNKVMVQGDTTSAFVVALCAFHRKIPVIHLEAGMRSGNKYSPYPEEMNRIAIDRISDYHLCVSTTDEQNLKTFQGKGAVVGQTGLDWCYGITPTAGDTVFCTMHRRENQEHYFEWVLAINGLANKYPELSFVFPIHPSLKVVVERNPIVKINFIEPLSHAESIETIAKSAAVITDSGGVQEEACFFRKRAFICRTNLERTLDINLNAVQCINPYDLQDLFDRHIYKQIKPYRYCPYGDGRSSELVAKLLNEELK